jgi:hypothetical protein
MAAAIAKLLTFIFGKTDDLYIIVYLDFHR